MLNWLLKKEDVTPDERINLDNAADDETTALNMAALFIIPRLTALQPGILRKLKKRLRDYDVSKQVWKGES